MGAPSLLCLVVAVAPGRAPSRTTSAHRPTTFDHTTQHTTHPRNLGTLGKQDIALGTIAWVPKNTHDQKRLKELAQKAALSNVNLIDTAERYGASPVSLIPAALAGLGLPLDKSYLGGDCESNLAEWAPRSNVATKFTPTPWRTDAQSVVDACEASRARLGVERIALYQIHMPDIIQPFKALGVEQRKDEIYWDGLAECYHRGLVANVGVSNYGPTLLERAQEALAKRGVPLASNQIAFNLLCRRDGSLATVEKGAELGVATLAYYPLAMGLLTGKLTGSKLRSRSDARSQDLLRYLEGGDGGTAGAIPANGIRPLLMVLHAVAAAEGRTPAQVALNWIISKGAIPIVGATSQLQLEENLGATGWRLADERVAELDAAADALDFDFRGAGFQTTDSKFVGYGFERWRLD